MRDTDKMCPCYNCSKRSAGCHSSCGDYKEYQERAAQERDLIYKQRTADANYVEVRVKAAGKRRKQKAWRDR